MITGSEKDQWEVCDLKFNKCRTKLSIRKDSKYRNTYCIQCGVAHLWVRVDDSEYKRRQKEKSKQND
jgi:hypothetical protein